MQNYPVITINGQQLTEAQATTVRVAVSSFMHDMEEPEALGKDETGKSITAGYVDRCREVIGLMQKS